MQRERKGAFKSWRILAGVCAVAVFCALSGTTVMAKGKPGGSGGGNGGGGGNSSPCTAASVSSTLNDYDLQVPAQPFQIQSDGHGAYTSYSSGHGKNADTLTSEVGSGCMWTLDTTHSTSRGIELTLAYPDASQPAPPFVGPQLVHAVMHTHCTDDPNNNGVDFGSMTKVGQTLSCPVNVAFYAPSGTWYNLAMNPFNVANVGGTTETQVTCTGAAGGVCNQWTVKPDPATAVVNTQTNQSSAIGELFLPSCVGCAGGTPLGLYEVSFSFLVNK